MKHIFKIGSFIFALALLLTACSKMDPLPFYSNGNSVVLSSSASTLTPGIADSTSDVVAFSWTNPKYAQDSASYKFVVEIDSATKNFANEATKIVVGKFGTTLTGRELNAILLDYGYALGAPVSLEVRVTSSYGNNNERYYSNTVNLSVTPFNDPSVLSSSETDVTCTLPNAGLTALGFSWSPSFTGYTGNITYVIQYDSATKNFVAPTDIVAGVGTTFKEMTQGELNQTAITSGIPGGNSGTVEYRIKATTAQGAISYSNVVNVNINSYVSTLRFYMPGDYQGATGNGNNWDPPTAPELIRDVRAGVLNSVYYTYIYLPANSNFKVTQGRSWSINYGGTGTDLELNSSNNLHVNTAGFYRVSIDINNLKYDIREGRMGFVGGATAAGWNPPNVFPAYALGTAATNLFVGLHDFGTGGWKLIDNDSWNSSSLSVDNTRSYGTPSGSGSTLEINGSNFADITTAGRSRVIWDGRNVDNVKYEMSPASEMRVVGDGMNVPGVNDWDPGTSPQMTYSGNGVWTITIDLKANKDIKFLAGNAWGAFDYEDNSGQSQATGTDKRIKWEGGDNFKTPTTAGTYTITLNENLQTMSIN